MEIHSDPHSASTSNPLRTLGNANPAMACKEVGVKLFGVRLTENVMLMRKAVSMGNLSCYNSASSLQAPHPSTPEHSESGYRHGYVSDGLIQNSGGLRERKKEVWKISDRNFYRANHDNIVRFQYRSEGGGNQLPPQVAGYAVPPLLTTKTIRNVKGKGGLFYTEVVQE